MIGVSIGVLDKNNQCVYEHSYEKYGLILASASVPLPEVKTLMVEVPGTDGTLDLTEIFGKVRYAKRIIKLSFALKDNFNHRFSISSQLAAAWHGKKARLIFDDDLGHYYEGRLSLGSWTAEKELYSIEVTAECDPYKYDIQTSTDDWLWDPFSFVDGVVRQYKRITVNGNKTVTVDGSIMDVVPTFIATESMTVIYDGKRYSIPAGSSKIYDIVITNGSHDITFVGSGIVSIEYRGGAL